MTTMNDRPDNREPDFSEFLADSISSSPSLSPVTLYSDAQSGNDAFGPIDDISADEDSPESRLDESHSSTSLDGNLYPDSVEAPAYPPSPCSEHSQHSQYSHISSQSSPSQISINLPVASTPSSSSLALSNVQNNQISQSVILSEVPRYLVLTVSQPQRISDGSTNYVSYLVTAQNSADEKVERCRRRFKDFVKLHDQLVTEYPAFVIPPLPDRWRIEYIAGDRFSPEFTNKRAASLERFLFRISQHPYLRRSRAFTAFLSSQQFVPSFSSRPASTQARSSSSQSAHQDSAALAALDQIGETLMNAFVKAKNQSKEMIDARERAGRYEQNIITIDKAVVRVSKTQNELALDFEDMYHQALKLAKVDPQCSQDFEMLAATASALLRATQQLRTSVDTQFACALRDMSHYVQALKGMLKQREQRQIDYEALVEYLKRAEHELVATEHGQVAPTFSSSFLRSKMNELRGIDKEQTRQQRIVKLKDRISEMKGECQLAKQISDDFEELAKQEVRIFDQSEAIELQQSLSGLSDSYIEYYQNILSSFRELAAKFDQ